MTKAIYINIMLFNLMNTKYTYKICLINRSICLPNIFVIIIIYGSLTKLIILK